MKPKLMFLIVIWLGAALMVGAAEKDKLNPNLEPLRPLLNKTMKGTFKNADKPTVDVQRWESALKGQAVRLRHSINDGVYAGETMFVWDETKKSIVYYYFTTAGFMTTGTLEVKEGKFITHEEVKGNAGGVAEVRGTSYLQDGKLYVKTEYLKDGEWVQVRETTYEESPTSKVVID